MRRRNRVNKVQIVIFISFFFLFLIIIARLIYLNLATTIDGINLSEFAKNRNTKKETLYATRGSIYDSNGEVLAQTVDSYNIIAYLDKSRSKNSRTPMHVVDKKKTAEKLSPIINMSVDRIYELLNQKGLYQVELGPGGKGLTELQKEQIEKLKLPGIDFVSTSKRYYPNLDFASYTLGYVTTNENGTMTGEMGIEQYYNDKLTGTNGSLEYQTDANGYKLIDSSGSPEIRIDKIDGMNIYLTIDSNVQMIVERALNNYFESSKASSGGLIVADAKTGKILASASRPSFDPNIKDIQNYMDPLVSTAFEPGSTMKTYTYMCALEKGTYKGNDTYMSGTMKIGEYTIKDWNNYGWGEVTYDYGYLQSSNIGIANLVQKYITRDDLLTYFKKLGFGAKTGIELPNEVTGKISFKYDIEVATAGFGQGITTTPIQHIKALTSISNNGYLLSPTIVEKIVDSNTGKTVYKNKTKKGTKVASIETVNKMKELMYNVVNGEGTGTSYHLDGYDIIGKTGTAEYVNAGSSSYTKGSYIKSFEGMYPKDNPKLIFYVYLDKASVNTMPQMIKSVVQDVETYYNITKVNSNTKTIYKMPNFLNNNINSVKDALNVAGIKYEVLGDGTKVINQYPLSGTIVNGRVFIMTNSNNISVPNIKGYSRKDAINLAKVLGVEYSLEGNGYVNDYAVELDSNGKVTKINMKLTDKYVEN